MMPEDFNQQNQEFKPNIYPIMYWAIAYGAIAGTLLFLLFVLSQYITYVWIPVFLAGLAWGAYRNYKKQKNAWANSNGVAITPQSPITEFKEAAQDIIGASRDMMAQNAAEDAYEEQLRQQEAMREEQIRMGQMPPEEQQETYQQEEAPQEPAPQQPTPPNVPRNTQATPPQSTEYTESDTNRPPQV